MNGPRVNGFTLLEVMIALAIFAGFATSVAIFQAAEIKGSTAIREEMVLSSLALLKINELHVNPPEFGISKTLTADSGEFPDYPGYKYTINYKQISFKNLDQMIMPEDSDDSESVDRAIVAEFVEHLSDTMWLVTVTVEKGTSRTTLTTWLKDDRSFNVF
jgi:prepilin-type N-terminal cleavage/methylation domain-containing protein